MQLSNQKYIVNLIAVFGTDKHMGSSALGLTSHVELVGCCAHWIEAYLNCSEESVATTRMAICSDGRQLLLIRVLCNLVPREERTFNTQ